MKLLITLALTLLISFTAAINGPPLTSETARGPEAVATASISAYKYAFSKREESKSFRIIPPIVTTPDSNRCHPPCISGCQPCMLMFRGTEPTEASWPGKTEFADAPPTPTPKAINLPWTATSNQPRRTIIVRATPTNDGPIAAIRNFFREVPGAEEPIRAEEAETVPEQHLEHNPHWTGPLVLPRNETTKTWYTFALSGFDPVILPLMLPAPSMDNRPVTLLAYANTTIFSSFISSSLVEDLGLWSQVKQVHHNPSFLPERDLTALVGYSTDSMGVLPLDLLAGAHDRFVDGMNFTVFRAPNSSGSNTRSGRWEVDLMVGWDFLNRIQAVKLTEEYSGSRKAGARDGVGVFVQRVFEPRFRFPEPTVRDEL